MSIKISTDKSKKVNVRQIAHFIIYNRYGARTTIVESEAGNGHTYLQNLYSVFKHEIGVPTWNMSVGWIGLTSWIPRIAHLAITDYSVDEVADMIKNRLEIRKGLRPSKVIVIQGTPHSKESRVTMADAVQDADLPTSTDFLELINNRSPDLNRAADYAVLSKRLLDPRDALYPEGTQSLNDEQAVTYIKTWIGSDTDDVINAAAYSCRPICVKKVLELGSTVERTTKHGFKQNILELALMSFYGTLEQRKEIVDLAVKHGANLTHKVLYLGNDMTLLQMMDSKIKYLKSPWDGTRCVKKGENDARIEMFRALKAYLIECGAK